MTAIASICYLSYEIQHLTIRRGAGVDALTGWRLYRTPKLRSSEGKCLLRRISEDILDTRSLLLGPSEMFRVGSWKLEHHIPHSVTRWKLRKLLCTYISQS